MIPLFTPEEFEAAKCHQLLPLKCKHCGETFHRTKHTIQCGLRNSHHSTADYCSHSCQANCQHKGHRLELACDQCKGTFSKDLNQIQKSKHHFCCQSCAGKYHNAHKTTGTRRSKLEVWLEAQLITLYPDLGFHFNRTDAIDAELDVFIPSLKLAFELNGIFHYEPIYGQNKFNRMVSNDQRKFAACSEKGIGLCIIDVSKIKYFKDRTSKPILEIIQKVISQAISLQY